MAQKFISYTRVSTNKQGLGIDAQQSIIADYVERNNGVVIATFSEKESAKDTIHRKGLQDAICMAKQTGAILLVAKLDRLSRDIADIFALKKDRKLTFAVCDMDASDTLTLGIFATLAQKERELISKRTREALAELKRKGVKLGNPRAAEQMRKAQPQGCAARRAKALANEKNRHAYDAIRLMGGTLQARCDYLNNNGYTTSGGGSFSPIQVSRLLRMYAD